MRAPLKTALASWAPSINIIIIIIIIIKLLLSFIFFICALYSYSLGFSMMLLHTQRIFYKKVWLIVRFFFSKVRFKFLTVMVAYYFISPYKAFTMPYRRVKHGLASYNSTISACKFSSILKRPIYTHKHYLK